ncbi:related to Rossmann fold nucleotide-binding protein [Rhynchosporium secalis]|uniref:Related to Rossmann fold nucleotide-binding protein n=1 Tax=Rhynchosporium secalis TaxID=38038 RepID=A0A1E1LZS9_RHYSE|nr:related to Rossmann fold nucleotide-binding protein [Rhynchosporium secalis]
MAQAIVCVFCGSSPGKSPAFMEAAKALGVYFHENKINLVYGGGTTGLMGEVARTLVALSGPESVQGIIPAPLMQQEQRTNEITKATYEGREYSIPDENIYGRTMIVKDMHSRKQEMAKRVIEGGPGSGFVALPGGYGTWEELMEVVTWNQLGIHDKPVVILNVEGYYSGLLTQMRSGVEAGFVSAGQADIAIEAKTAEECGLALKNYLISDGRLNLEWTSN